MHKNAKCKAHYQIYSAFAKVLRSKAQLGKSFGIY